MAEASTESNLQPDGNEYKLVQWLTSSHYAQLQSENRPIKLKCLCEKKLKCPKSRYALNEHLRTLQHLNYDDVRSMSSCSYMFNPFNRTRSVTISL